MTYKMPLRLTILHFAQRFLIDDDTFIIYLLDRPHAQRMNGVRNFNYIRK